MRIKEKVIKKYICPFCEKEKKCQNRTEINYRGKWFFGCQDCFMKSIDNTGQFNDKNYQLIEQKRG